MSINNNECNETNKMSYFEKRNKYLYLVYSAENYYNLLKVIGYIFCNSGDKLWNGFQAVLGSTLNGILNI